MSQSQLSVREETVTLLDFASPPGRLAMSSFLPFARQAAERLAAEGVDAEVIDVRSLSPIDYATIGESVRKTGRVVIVEEGPKTGGVGAEIAAGIMERFGDSLLAPVVRVASADAPVPFSPVLENAYRPDAARIIAAAREVMR
jgi:pyruvate/2-oxoglutarate/acetoin dehydrogenase E1 component